jgi:hypothetical protein
VKGLLTRVRLRKLMCKYLTVVIKLVQNHAVALGFNCWWGPNGVDGAMLTAENIGFPGCGTRNRFQQGVVG